MPLRQQKYKKHIHGFSQNAFVICLVGVTLPATPAVLSHKGTIIGSIFESKSQLLSPHLQKSATLQNNYELSIVSQKHR